MIPLVISIAVLSIIFSPDKSLPYFWIAIGSSTAILLFICLWKGEKPTWRWVMAKRKNDEVGYSGAMTWLGVPEPALSR